MSNSYIVSRFGKTYQVSNVSSYDEACNVVTYGSSTLYQQPVIDITPNLPQTDEQIKETYLFCKNALKNKDKLSENDKLKFTHYVNLVEIHRQDIIKKI